MKKKLDVNILSQPDDTTCGPTCLHAVYSYYKDKISLKRVVDETQKLSSGGTLAVFLALHALKRGYKASIYTYNLQLFDPSWFENKNTDLIEKIRIQGNYKHSKKIKEASEGYIEFLKLGGKIKFTDLTPSLIRSYLNKSIPILTGLSSTYLYKSVREYGENSIDDDIKGEPAGHFVVLTGYDKLKRQVIIADPFFESPLKNKNQIYGVDMKRLLNSILLGILTYDANLLILEKK